MPQSAHSKSLGCVLALVSGGIWREGSRLCVGVVPSGLCHTFYQFRSFLLHFLFPACLLKHLSSQFLPIFLCISDVPPPICPVPCLPFFLISNGFVLLWMVFLPYQHQQIFLTPKSSSFSDFCALCRAVFIDCRMACLSKRLPGCTLWSFSFRSCCRVVSALLHVLPGGSRRSTASKGPSRATVLIDIRLTWNKGSWKMWHRAHVIAGDRRLANRPQSFEEHPAQAVFPCLHVPVAELLISIERIAECSVQRVPWKFEYPFLSFFHLAFGFCPFSTGTEL